jgi:AraC-like DNA-binding protein
MVNKGQVGVPHITFTPPIGAPGGIEVITLDLLHAKDSEQFLTAPQRPSFHQLIAVHRGQLRHSVDFDEFTVREGEWLWTRPGQVLQWGEPTEAAGTVVMFESGHLDAVTLRLARVDQHHEPVLRVPNARTAGQLDAVLEQLREAFDELLEPPLPLRMAALHHLLAVLLLRLAQVSGDVSGARGPANEIFWSFQAEVEKSFSSTRRLADYADALGYSSKTLTRASEAAIGMGAKRAIDERVVLEAQRLLAHSAQQVSSIASSLGFSSATNFAKFFQLHTGLSPSAFRDQFCR